MSSQANIQLDEEFIAATNAHDVKRIMAVLSDDVIVTDVVSPEPVKGNAAYGQILKGIFESFPDYSVAVKNRVVSEDKVATEFIFSGTHQGPLAMGPGNTIPATGKKFTANGAQFARVRNGKIVELHMHPDIAGFMMQLGLIPAPGQNGS
jgi:steroid delta-isomerase-like uncharacterized protein